MVDRDLTRVDGLRVLITGLVTAFPGLVLAQMLWGFGWTFSSGADVAWVTDELGDPLRIDRVLTARARWQQFGAVVGMVGFGALAWTSSLSTAIVAAGSMMVLLGGYVVVRFTEHEFEPTREHRWKESKSIFRRGLSLARNDREIMLVFTVTILINSGAEAFDRLFPKRLVAVALTCSAGMVGCAGLVVTRSHAGRDTGASLASSTT
jgi:hypothetical protein